MNPWVQRRELYVNIAFWTLRIPANDVCIFTGPKKCFLSPFTYLFKPSVFQMDTMSSVPASRGAGSLYAGRNSRPTSPNAPNPTYASLGPSDHSGPSRGHQGVRGYQQPTQYTTIQQPSIVINSDQQAYPTYQDPLYATRGQGSQQSDIFWDWYHLYST